MTDKVLKQDPQSGTAAKVSMPTTQAIALPPDLINSIIEKILAALIERILAYFQPSQPPPAVINPPPIIVGPPITVDPGPPTSPPLVYEQWLQAGATVFYHNWFKGNVDEGVPAGNSTASETEKVRQGLMIFPPAARAHISADPMPRNCVEYPYPKIHVILKNEVTGVEQEQVLTREDPQPESFVIIQGGQTASGIYLRSNGHFFILVFDAPTNRSSVRIWMEASNGARSNEFGMPWCSQGDRATRAAGAQTATQASRAAEPFVYDEEPVELEQRTLYAR